jgi:lipopolysaccharide biosynthesis glycosyltransferase
MTGDTMRTTTVMMGAAAAPTRPTLAIVSSANQAYYPGLAVTFCSALATASGACDYHLFVLDGGIAPGDLDRLRHQLEAIAALKGVKATLQRLTFDESQLPQLREHRGSRMTYAKLLLPELLPGLATVLYVDADIICFKGLEEIVPPAGPAVLLAGCLDGKKFLEKDCPWSERLTEAERSLPYINAGLLWMNLDALRAMKFSALALDAAAGVTRLGDQPVFNFLCRGHIAVLPGAYNFQASFDALELASAWRSSNVHCTSPGKPWQAGSSWRYHLSYLLWQGTYQRLFLNAASRAAPSFARAAAGLTGARVRQAFYRLVNPARARMYRVRLLETQCAGNLLPELDRFWNERLRVPGDVPGGGLSEENPPG